MLIAYKLLWKSPYTGELWSFVAEDKKDHSVQYKLDEIIYPKVGKLFVFDNLQNLNNFRENNTCRDTVVYEVMAYDVSTEERMLSTWYADRYGSIELFWNGDQIDEYKIETTPQGTLYCGSLELLEEISG